MKKRKQVDPADTVATTVRLRRATVEWLRTSELGITPGIKQGLELLIFEQQFDKETLELASNVMLLAKEVQQQTRTDWHRAPAAYEAFAEAVKTWLDFLKPVPMAGSTGVQAGQSEADISAGDDPKTLGRAIARTLNNNPPDQLRRIRNANLKRIWETDS